MCHTHTGTTLLGAPNRVRAISVCMRGCELILRSIFFFLYICFYFNFFLLLLEREREIMRALSLLPCPPLLCVCVCVCVCARALSLSLALSLVFLPLPCFFPPFPPPFPPPLPPAALRTLFHFRIHELAYTNSQVEPQVRALRNRDLTDPVLWDDACGVSLCVPLYAPLCVPLHVS